MRRGVFHLIKPKGYTLKKANGDAISLCAPLEFLRVLCVKIQWLPLFGCGGAVLGLCVNWMLAFDRRNERRSGKNLDAFLLDFRIFYGKRPTMKQDRTLDTLMSRPLVWIFRHGEMHFDFRLPSLRATSAHSPKLPDSCHRFPMSRESENRLDLIGFGWISLDCATATHRPAAQSRQRLGDGWKPRFGRICLDPPVFYLPSSIFHIPSRSLDLPGFPWICPVPARRCLIPTLPPRINPQSAIHNPQFEMQPRLVGKSPAAAL